MSGCNGGGCGKGHGRIGCVDYETKPYLTYVVAGDEENNQSASVASLPVGWEFTELHIQIGNSADGEIQQAWLYVGDGNSPDNMRDLSASQGPKAFRRNQIENMAYSPGGDLENYTEFHWYHCAGAKINTIALGWINEGVGFAMINGTIHKCY